MPKHFEQAPGLYDAPVPETEGYVFNQTMMRIKEPERSLDFYTRVLGMHLIRKLDFPEMKFTLYFLGYLTDREMNVVPHDDAHRTTYMFGREAMLELTHNWGTEDDKALPTMATTSPRVSGTSVLRCRMCMRPVTGLRSWMCRL